MKRASQPPPRPPVEPRVGYQVRTPAGHPGMVTAVCVERREATVLRLDDGEMVRFRFCKLIVVEIDP